MSNDLEFFRKVEAAVNVFIGELRSWRNHAIDDRNSGAVAFRNRLDDAIDNLEPLAMIMRPCIQQAEAIAALGAGGTAPTERPARVMVSEDEEDSPLAKIDENFGKLIDSVQEMKNVTTTMTAVAMAQGIEDEHSGLMLAIDRFILALSAARDRAKKAAA